MWEILVWRPQLDGWGWVHDWILSVFTFRPSYTYTHMHILLATQDQLIPADIYVL